jgi:hypothetical protein
MRTILSDFARTVAFGYTFCGLATVFGFEISNGFFGRKISFFGTGTVGSRTSPTSDGFDVAFVVSDVGDVGVRGLKEAKGNYLEVSN